MPDKEGKEVLEYIAELEADKAKLEEEVNTQKTLLDTMVHDLRSPLTVMNGYLKLLLRIPEAEKYASIVYENAIRMQKQISDQSYLSQAGQLIGEKTELDLYNLVEDAAEFCGFENQAENIYTLEDTQLIIDPLPDITAHERSISQVYQNLISNAVKYGKNEDGQSEITIGYDIEKEMLYVRDNGKGIPDDIKDSIFDYGVTTEGTGIGLAIVKKYIEAHDGEIYVESKKGDGTTFYFTFSETDNHPVPAFQNPCHPGQ